MRVKLLARASLILSPGTRFSNALKSFRTREAISSKITNLEDYGAVSFTYLKMNEGSLHTRSLRLILSVFRYR